MSTIEDADVILILVKHRQFVNLIPEELINLTPARMIIDTVKVCDIDSWDYAGFTVYTLGDNLN